MLVHHFLENSADRYPDANAVWCKNSWETYKSIEENANCIANCLIAAGVKCGDRIALLMENSVEYIINYFAILKAGGVVVAINNESTQDNVRFFLNSVEAVAFIAGRKFSKLLPVLAEAPSVRLLITDMPLEFEGIMIKMYHDILDERNISRPDIDTISLDLASVVFTSGSTGEPKGVMLSHQNLCDNTVSITQYLKLTKDDRIMVVLPFYYIYGNSLLTTHFHVGGSLVIDNRFMFPNVVIKTMQETMVTGFAGVPSTFMILLNKSIIRKSKVTSLRYVTQAGGSMAPAVQKEVAATFSPADLYIMYGTTEAAPRLTYLEPEMLQEKMGSIGKAVPNVDVIIADKDGNKLPPETTGEIAARGSNIMVGYWNDPESTAAVIRNGYYFTGDLGKIDKDGFIYVVGRTKDMIKVAGNRVSGKEIEEALLSLPEIEEVAVIGIPDQILGEAIKAFIVLRDGNVFKEDVIKKKLSLKIALYKIPKFFTVLSSLPKNKSGKIMKEALKKTVQEESS